jgi:hypothetical protein
MAPPCRIALIVTQQEKDSGSFGTLNDRVQVMSKFQDADDYRCC